MNAFVTGGSRGIGRAIVVKLAQEGIGCAFTYVNDAAAAEETAALAKSAGPAARVKAYRMDCKNAAQVDATAETVIDDFTTIDAVVNNAAVVRNNAAALMSNEEWDEVIATNLSGPFYVVRSFLMHFIANRNGRIVTISSLAAGGSSGQVNYSASKAGVEGMSRTLAKEYGPKGITSNCVTVGYVETDMAKNHMSADLRTFWLKFCPLKKTGTAEEIADAVHFLISDAGRFINGETIHVTGGLTYAP
jgi:3-oxoacyl-[acyl-carrier protein] reductase